MVTSKDLQSALSIVKGFSKDNKKHLAKIRSLQKQRKEIMKEISKLVGKIKQHGNDS